tara:strand:+ start:1880 stop:2080 length:201 start_codon:yes stop_codon:yes gene_type:complete
MKYKNREGRMMELLEGIPVPTDALCITEMAEDLDTPEEQDAFLMGAYITWNLISELLEAVGIGEVE